MVDLTKPVQTRDGRKVRVLCTDRKDATYPVVALVGDAESPQTFTLDGCFLFGNDADRDNLINVPEKRKRRI